MQKPRIFYGWIVVAACFVANTTLSEAFSSFGIFFNPLEAEFGWSRSLISSGFTVFLVGYAISAFISGRLADRYKPRIILLISALLAGFGLAMSSQVNSVDQLRVFSFIAGMGSGATQAIPVSAVQRWFNGRKGAGIAMGVVISGAGFGSLVFPFLINHFILGYGWRGAYVATGIILFVLITASAIFIRPSPAQAETFVRLKSKNSVKSEDLGWRTGRVLTTISYAGVFYVVSIGAIAAQIITSQLVPNAIDKGLSPTQAATVLGLSGGISIAGRLLAGVLSNKIGWKKTLALAFGGMTAGFTWLSLTDATWMLYGFAILYGVFSGMRIVAHWGIVSEFFGIRSIAELVGITSGGSILVAAAAPYITGFIYDATGSYFIAFMIAAAMAFSGCIVITLLKKPVLNHQK